MKCLCCIALFFPLIGLGQPADSIQCRTQTLYTHQGAWIDPMPSGCYAREVEDITQSIPASFQKSHKKVLDQVRKRCGDVLFVKLAVEQLLMLKEECGGVQYIYHMALPFQERWDYRFSLVTDKKGNIVSPDEIPLPDVSLDIPPTAFVDPCEAAYNAQVKHNVQKPLTHIVPGFSFAHNQLVWKVYGYGMMPKEKLENSPFLYDPHKDVPVRVHDVALVSVADGKVLEVIREENLSITIPDPWGVHPIIRKRKNKDP